MSSLTATLHPILAKRALFISMDLLIPKPPTLLGVHIESHAFRYKTPLSSFLPHQKSLRIASILAQVDLGKIRDDMG